MKFLLFLLMFFILGALLIASNNNLAFIKDENIKSFSVLYSDWLDRIFSNTKTITGNVIEMDWTAG